MKMYRLIAAVAFLAACTVHPALGQTRPATPAATPASAPATPTKIALIFSDLFQDPTAGIARITVTMNTLNREFQPRQTELNQMVQKIKQLQDEIAKAQQSTTPVDGKALQAKIDLLDQTKKDYQRKGEDAKANYDKRKQEVFGPVQEDISKALEAYAKTHGITVLIDGSAVPLAYAADNLDITRAFIADYNSKNPATAVLAPAK